MKHYEILFIVKPTLTDEEVSTRLDFVKDVITKNGGEIAGITEMGTRKLAYKIDKYERGTYFVIYFKSEPSMIAELNRVARINEDIIRFLIVKYENKKEISAWEKLSKGLKLVTKKEYKKESSKKEVEKEEASSQE